MKIAYLITAYHHPQQFQRLVRGLAYPDFHCFAHVDRKVDIAAFAVPNCHHLTFLQKRLSIAPASFAMMEALLALLRTAVATDTFEYYVYLSGQDYPLKSNAFIAKFFEKHAGKNFLSAYPVSQYSPKAGNFYHYHHTALLSQLPAWAQPPSEKLYYLVSRRLLPRRQLRNGMQPFRGLTWMALHRETVQYLLDYLETGEGRYVCDFFKYVWAPTEFFFHTLILNSPHAERCHNYVSPALSVDVTDNYLIDSEFHYCDWSSEREDPAILDERDMPHLLTTKALFARKFDEVRSAAIMDDLDKRFAALEFSSSAAAVPVES